MPEGSAMKRICPITGAIAVALLLAAGIGVYYYSGWSRINCWTWEVDINSGLTRYTRYWFWYATEERTVSTWMSDALGTPAGEEKRDWQPVATLSPGTRHSPPYVYHRAIYDLDVAWGIIGMYQVPQERKLQLAKAVTDSWRQTGRDSGAAQLVGEFAREAFAGKHGKVRGR